MARYKIKKCKHDEDYYCGLWLVFDFGAFVSEWPSWRDAFKAVQQRQGRDAFVHPARRNWQLPETKRWSDG